MEKINSSLKYWGRRLISGWDFMKVLRLSLPVSILIVAWNTGNIAIAVIGGIMLFIALFNMGRCYETGCDINQPKKRFKSLEKVKEDTTFTELK